VTNWGQGRAPTRARPFGLDLEDGRSYNRREAKRVQEPGGLERATAQKETAQGKRATPSQKPDGEERAKQHEKTEEAQRAREVEKTKAHKRVTS